MKQYLGLLREIRENGARKAQRAELKSSGQKPDVLSVFGRMIRFDLRDGFPLVTTKAMPFGSVVRELLWFLSGSTNNNDLMAQGVTIWKEWADPKTGELGPIYGKQWRSWEGSGGREVDQIEYLVHGIRAVIADPHHSGARRLILTAWNPPDMPLTRGPSACHTMAQFSVTEGQLSCMMFQRSADMLLGVPFNIASYALLTHLLAQVTGLGVGDYVHAFGDAHIYWNQLEAVDEQLPREPFPLPTLRLDPSINSMDNIRPEQIELVGYQSHPRLTKVEVAV
jgi:thymidylate synthase